MSGRLVLVAGDGPLGERLATGLAASWRGVVERWRGRTVGMDAALAGDRPPPGAVVYAAADRGRRGLPDPDDAAAVVAACARIGVPRVVVLSSTEIYPPSPHHPGLLDEDRFAARPGRNAVADLWLRLEERAAAAAGRGTELCILRCAPAPVPGGDDLGSRLLTGRLAAKLPGHDPSIQLLAVDDLAAAAARAAAGPGRGPYNVVPAGTAPLGKALRLAGVRGVPVPRWTRALARRAAGDPVGADRLDYLRYPWTAAGERARDELGFAPRWTSGAVARWVGEGAPVGAGPPEAPSFDDFGMDRDYIALFGRTLFRVLHDGYWRVEHRGLEHVPREGRAVLTGVHRGFMPWDGVMALHLLVRETGRYPRFLLHPTLVKFPFLFDYMTKLGGVLACRENAARVLDAGGILGVFPEGIHGAFTPYRRAYRLGKFGRDEYVRMALRSRAPIVPFVTVGSAEIYPILGRIDWSWWKRYSLWPYLPITPTFPWLPLPLPSKWHTRFLEPLHVEREHGPEAADDPAAVRAISAEVRRRMRRALDEMLGRRRSIFFGSVFDPEERPAAAPTAPSAGPAPARRAEAGR